MHRTDLDVTAVTTVTDTRRRLLHAACEATALHAEHVTARRVFLAAHRPLAERLKAAHVLADTGLALANLERVARTLRTVGVGAEAGVLNAPHHGTH